MRANRSAAVPLLLLVPVFAALGAPANRIQAEVDPAQRVVLADTVTPRLAAAKDLGMADQDAHLNSVVLLLQSSTQQKQELQQLLADLQNPASPNYHRWLTSEQYAERFGLSNADVEKVRGWLESQGFHIDRVGTARNWIMFSGKHSQAAAAFHTEIHRFQIGQQVHFANASNLEIPAALAGVVAGVHGLTDFYPKPPHRQGLKPQYYVPDSADTLLGPADLALVYNIKPLYSAGYSGTGVSIAVVGQTDFAMSDITAYRNFFGLPANQPQIILTGSDPGIASDDDEAEAELDLEVSGAVAPNAAIKYVNSRDVLISALYAIDQNLAPIITMSYGSCEQEAGVSLDTWRGYIQQANASGITFFAAAGDAGAFACDWDPTNPVTQATHGVAVNFPASVPEVTAVGGTSIVASTSTQNASDKSNVTALRYETAWNDELELSFATAGGGGPSQHFSKPAWQNVPGVPADGFRDLPDISLSAEASKQQLAYAICLQGSCQSGNVVAVGGTSAASPVAAGILAVLTQYEVGTGGATGPGFGNINPRLYQLSQTSPAAFNDVASGNTNVPCLAGTPGCPSNGVFGYTASTGYDLATGLGSLNAFELARAWNLPSSRNASTVTVSSNAQECSTNIALTATVSAVSGITTTPSGSVYFYYSSGLGQPPLTLLGSAPLSAGSQVSATLITNLSALSDDVYPVIIAVYTGDGAFAGSVSAAQQVMVVRETYDTVTLLAGSPTVLAGTPLSFTAHVGFTCGPEAGTFNLNSFLNGLFPLPPPQAVDANGNALFTVSIPSGAATQILTIRADYSDSAGSTSSNAISVAIVNPNQEYTLTSFAGTGVAGLSGDGGPATAAQLQRVDAVAADAQGNVYIADGLCNCVRKVNPSGIITTYVTNLTSPSSLAVGPDGSLYIAETGQIVKVTAGVVASFAGSGTCGSYSGEGGPAVHATLCPAFIAADTTGNLFVTDAVNNRVYKIGAASGIISTFAGTGAAATVYPTELDGLTAAVTPIQPNGVTTDSQGDVLIVAGWVYTGYDALYQVKSDGILHLIGQGVSSGIAVDSKGNVFAAGGFNENQVYWFSGGQAYAIAGTGASGVTSSQNALLGQMATPTSLAVDRFDNLYVGDSAVPAVQVLKSYSNSFNNPLGFVPLTPCRIADTRLNTTVFGGIIPAQQSRAFPIAQTCGIPAAAQAYSLNITAVPPHGLSYLTLWPSNQPQPFVSLLNSDGRVKANAAIVRGGDGGAVSTYATDATDVVIDVDGYFVPATTSGALSFYPLNPCRIADTRLAASPLGGPILNAGQKRSFPVLSSSCSVPANAQAYSLNFTVVPKAGLGYLSTWPTGTAQPLVSTLNSNGAIVANAAIVPAGTNGAINVYASDTTDVIIDINGYFAAQSGGGLWLYTSAPCRPFDTRTLGSGAPFNGTISANIGGSNCGVPAAAQAFALNATVVPQGLFGYLSLWPNGQAQPLVSTLNAFDGTITSNMAIVPATNGSINAFGTNPVQLILDLAGYFAP